MIEYIYFNEEWNKEDDDYCYKHGIKKSDDNLCPKCLEEKNNKYESDNRKFQGVRNNRKERVRRN